MPRSERNDLESPRYRGSAPALAEQEAPDSEAQTDPSAERLVADQSAAPCAVSTNNDAPCNGVAPPRKADGCSSDAPVTRCPDAPIMNTENQLEQIVDFLQRYLVCSDHQRLVLALWII